MNIGEFNRRVKLQTITRTPDGAGGFTNGLTDDATLWAKVEPLQGSQIVLADALRNEVTHRITIRYRAGITPRNRVSYGGRTMEILAVIDKEEAHIYQQLLCREMV